MRLLLVSTMIAVVSATAHARSVRFEGAFVPGKTGELVREIGKTLVPIYGIRGRLFQIRMQLYAMSLPPDERSRLRKWLDMDPADAGFLAEHLLHAKVAGPAGSAPRERLLTEAAEAMGDDEGRLSSDMGLLVDTRVLYPGIPLHLDPALILGLVADREATNRLVRYVKDIAKLAKRSKAIPKQIKRIKKKYQELKKKIPKDTKKAKKGSWEGILSLAVEAAAVGIGVPQVYEDLSALPDVLQDIYNDCVVVPNILASLREVLNSKALGMAAGAAFELARTNLVKFGRFKPLFALLGRRVPKRARRFAPKGAAKVALTLAPPPRPRPPRGHGLVARLGPVQPTGSQPGYQHPQAPAPRPQPAYQHPQAPAPRPQPAYQQPQAPTPRPQPAYQQPQAPTPRPQPAYQQPQAPTPRPGYQPNPTPAPAGPGHEVAPRATGPSPDQAVPTRDPALRHRVEGLEQRLQAYRTENQRLRTMLLGLMQRVQTLEAMLLQSTPRPKPTP